MVEVLKWEKISQVEKDLFIEKAKYLIERKYFLAHDNIEMLAKHIWTKQYTTNIYNNKV